MHFSLWQPFGSASGEFPMRLAGRRVAIRRCFASIMATVVSQAHAPNPYGGPRILAPMAAMMPASQVKATRVQAHAPETSPVMHATGLADWLRPESSQYKGLLLARQPSWRNCQDMVDRGAYRGDYGEMESILVRTSPNSKEGPADLPQAMGPWTWEH